MLYLLVPLPYLSAENPRLTEIAKEFLGTVDRAGVIASWATGQEAKATIVELSDAERAALRQKGDTQ